VRFIPDPYGRHECGPHATTPTTVVRACPLEDEMLYALAARAGRRVVVLTLLAPPLSSRKRSTPQQAQVQPLNIDGSYATARAVALLSRSGCTVVGLECLPPATMPYWGPSHVAFRRAVSIIAANSDAAREIAATRTGITWSQERGGVVYCPHAVCGDDESARAVAVPAADVDVAVRVEKDGIPRQSKRPISARSLTRWWERICCWLFR
jgi:hypothetical protein